MKRFWLSWYCDRMGEFELWWPWWVSGYRMDENQTPTICAAVIAKDEDAAWQVVIDSHDDPKPTELEQRFCEEQESDWSPFTDRFPRADWMRWPCPKDTNGDGDCGRPNCPYCGTPHPAR